MTNYQVRTSLIGCPRLESANRLSVDPHSRRYCLPAKHENHCRLRILLRRDICPHTPRRVRGHGVGSPLRVCRQTRASKEYRPEILVLLALELNMVSELVDQCSPWHRRRPRHPHSYNSIVGIIDCPAAQSSGQPGRATGPKQSTLAQNAPRKLVQVSVARMPKAVAQLLARPLEQLLWILSSGKPRRVRGSEPPAHRRLTCS